MCIKKTMTFTCMCLDDGTTKTVDQCSDCICTPGTRSSCTLDPQTSTNLVVGVTLSLFLVFLVISIVLLVLMIWFAVVVMKRCKGKPGWLNPTVITLLILWLLLGWVPGIGLVFFIALLILLIVYYNRCKKK